MVDAIGFKTTAVSGGTLAPVTKVAFPAAKVDSTETESRATATAKAAAASAPIDADRVALIKRAVQNGTYPISPERVADRLIALSLDWRP